LKLSPPPYPNNTVTQLRLAKQFSTQKIKILFAQKESVASCSRFHIAKLWAKIFRTKKFWENFCQYLRRNTGGTLYISTEIKFTTLPVET